MTRRNHDRIAPVGQFRRVLCELNRFARIPQRGGGNGREDPRQTANRLDPVGLQPDSLPELVDAF